MKRFIVLLCVCLLLFCGCNEIDVQAEIAETVFESNMETETETKSENAYCKHNDSSQIVVVAAEAPTCHQTGLTEGMKCNLCETMIVPQTIVPTIDCIRSVWIVGTEATKTKDGYKYIKCTMCGHVLETKNIHAGSQGLKYTQRIDGTYCEVYGIGSCQDDDLVIPAMYDEMPVKRIRDGAFYRCTSLSSVVIPEGVIAIGDKAFWECSALKSITIPHSVWRIDGIAFTGCTSLSDIYFDGTMEEWNSMGKNTGWNICSSKVTIHCTNGEISN